MDALVRIAMKQHGLFTAEQWKAVGRSRRQLRYRVASGLVREVHPGVFAMGGAPETLEQAVLAGCLSVGGVASHRCAAYLWGLRKFEAGCVEVLVRKDHTPSRPGVKVRRTARLEDADVTMVRGIPITRRARTLLDLCDVSPRLAEGALNGALHRRQVSVRQLLGALDRVGSQHPGSLRYRELVVPFAAGQRPTESELEDDFLDLVIRRYDLPRPVRQHPVGRRRIDFAYPELILGVEIDTVRFTFDDIHRWPDETAGLLDRTIARRRRAA